MYLRVRGLSLFSHVMYKDNNTDLTHHNLI